MPVREISCVKCGAPFELTQLDRDVGEAACSFCGQMNDLQEAFEVERREMYVLKRSGCAKPSTVWIVSLLWLGSTLLFRPWRMLEDGDYLYLLLLGLYALGGFIGVCLAISMSRRAD